jgi:hypothetical protein
MSATRVSAAKSFSFRFFDEISSRSTSGRLERPPRRFVGNCPGRATRTGVAGDNRVIGEVGECRHDQTSRKHCHLRAISLETTAGQLNYPGSTAPSELEAYFASSSTLRKAEGEAVIAGVSQLRDL